MIIPWPFLGAFFDFPTSNKSKGLLHLFVYVLGGCFMAYVRSKDFMELPEFPPVPRESFRLHMDCLKAHFRELNGRPAGHMPSKRLCDRCYTFEQRDPKNVNLFLKLTSLTTIAKATNLKEAANFSLARGRLPLNEVHYDCLATFANYAEWCSDTPPPASDGYSADPIGCAHCTENIRSLHADLKGH